MVWMVMVFMTAVCGLIQAALPPFASLGEAKVPLLLAAVVYYALNYDSGSAAVAALFAGVVHDVMSLMPLGQTSAVFLVVALVCGRFRRFVHGYEIHTTSLFGGAASLICVFAGYRLLANEGLVTISVGKLWYKAFGTFVLGLICTPFVCLAIRKIDAFVGNVATTEVIEDVLD